MILEPTLSCDGRHRFTVANRPHFKPAGDAYDSVDGKHTYQADGDSGFAFAGALLVVAGQDDGEALAVVAGYSLFMGLQMLLSMYFLQWQALKPIERPTGINQARAS